MQRACECCGARFEAQRSTARFCTEACKKRAKRGSAAVIEMPPRPEPADAEPALVARVRVELETAGRLNSAAGEYALDAARRVANSRDTGSSYAALSREARSALAEAVRGAHDPKSLVSSHKDELAARRMA